MTDFKLIHNPEEEMVLNASILGFLFLLLLSSFVLLMNIRTTQNRLDRKLKRIEFCLNLVVDHLEIDRFPEEIKEIALDPDPQKRFKAVSLYRKITGATFQEAVEAVEKLSGRRFKS